MNDNQANFTLFEPVPFDLAKFSEELRNPISVILKCGLLTLAKTQAELRDMVRGDPGVVLKLTIEFAHTRQWLQEMSDALAQATARLGHVSDAERLGTVSSDDKPGVQP